MRRIADVLRRALDRWSVDGRFQLRAIRRSRLLFAAAILNVALGVGITTTAFALIDGILLHRFLGPEPGRLIDVFSTSNSARVTARMSYPDYVDLSSQTSVFEELLAFVPDRTSVLVRDVALIVNVEAASHSYLSAIGLTPIRGRWFSIDEEHRKDSVVVISERLWRRHFQADPAVIGSRVAIGSHPFTVIGIAPPQFRGLHLPTLLPTDLWIPVGSRYTAHPGETLSRSNRVLKVKGRLRSDASVSEAREVALSLGAQLERDYPSEGAPRVFTTRLSSANWVSERVDSAAGPLVAATVVVALIVLVIACVNVGTLLLSRAADRRHEFAVRVALGAGGGSMLRLLFLEAAFVAGVGQIFGLLIVAGLLQLLPFVMPQPQRGVEFALQVAIDQRVLLFSWGIVLAITMACTMIPAWAVGRSWSASSLKNPVGTRFRTRRLLVAGQIAFAVALAVSAGLFVRSVHNIAAVDLDLRKDSLVVGVELSQHGYTAQRAESFFRRLMNGAEGLPGVKRVSLADRLPVRGQIYNSGLEFPAIEASTPLRRDSAIVPVDRGAVGPGYFETIGLSIRHGRGFTNADDSAGRRVAVISESLAVRLWGSKNPIGARVFAAGTGDAVGREIVGVVRDVSFKSLRQGAPPSRSWIYVPFAQHNATDAYVVVYAGRYSHNVLEDLRRIVAEIDPTVAVLEAQSLGQLVGSGFYVTTVASGVLSVLGIISIGLSLLGVFALFHYTVAKRTTEWAVRLALGATPNAIVGVVVREAMLLSIAGCVTGVGLALLAGGVAKSLLFNVSHNDPLTLISIPFAVLFVATLAAWNPAAKASRVSPNEILRQT